MPEGPEIRRAADKIADILEGKVIRSARLEHASVSDAKRHIVGHEVTAVECRGKALLTHFSSGRTLYSHNQLYGVWLTATAGLPRSRRALRLALQTDRGTAALFSATDISLWKTSEIESHPFLKKLGPDVLAPTTNTGVVLDQLRDDQHRNRQLATLYLDQGFVAGLGNYLRSEILFFAGVHPRQKPKDMSDPHLRALAKATVRVSQRSYKTGGVTLPVKLTPRSLHNKAGSYSRSYERDRFAVFARAGKPCRVCQTPIEKAVLASRRIYWCTTCQSPT